MQLFALHLYVNIFAQIKKNRSINNIVKVESSNMLIH